MNYHKMLLEYIEKLNGEKQKLLLHCCCAPCSSYTIDFLKDFFDITALYYNPNITETDEYTLRLNELKRFCASYNVPVIDGGQNNDKFFSLCKGLENIKEGGARCVKCISERLEFSAIFAKKNGFDLFTTTLTISPLKNAEMINKIGESLSHITPFLNSDFKKNDGYKKSIILSREYNLYRQNYCGCIFSKNEEE